MRATARTVQPKALIGQISLSDKKRNVPNPMRGMSLVIIIGNTIPPKLALPSTIPSATAVFFLNQWGMIAIDGMYLRNNSQVHNSEDVQIRQIYPNTAPALNRTL